MSNVNTDSRYELVISISVMDVLNKWGEEMILSEVHRDIERYLREDCYCPGEIYDCTSIFFEVFEPDEECRLICEVPTAKAVICRDQILVFWISEDIDRVIDADRCDATENNIKVVPLILSGKKTENDKLDEFEPGKTRKAFNEVMGIADAVLF